MDRWIANLIYKILGKEVRMMMALFFAQRVILEKIDFKDVPNSLKEQVKEILIDSGLEFLVVEE